MANLNKKKKLGIVMFPWIAYGHFTPFLHLSNKLAEHGHEISFLAPNSSLPRLEKLNLHPTLIHFIPLNIPHVPGLPPGAETNSDIPFSLVPQLLTAFDRTLPQVKSILLLTQPDFIFFDFSHWLPSLANELHVKSVYFGTFSAASSPGAIVPYSTIEQTPGDSVDLPPACPFPKVRLRPHEASRLSKWEVGIALGDRITKGMRDCDVMAMRTCHKVEGPYCDYIAKHYNKIVLATGHLLPKTVPQNIENTSTTWLQKFKPNSVVYCALGSQIALELPQFQEILLAFELTNLPFFLALQPPPGSASVEDALPEGFKERTQERGVVYGGWVPQPEILAHENVGCFVSHCGFGSMWEALLSECQMVLVPQILDQIINTRLMVEELEVAVEVESVESNGWISKESLCKAVKSVMDEDSEVGAQLKKNHAIWKHRLSGDKLQEDYIHNFINHLQRMLD